MKTSDPALVSHRTGGFRLRAVRYFGLVVSPEPASEDDPLLIPLELPELPEPDVLDPTEPELELPVPRLPELPLLLGELEDDPLVAELSVGDPVVALPEDPVVAGLSVGDPVVALPEDPVVDPPTLPDVPLRVSSVGELGLVEVELPVPVPVPELGVPADELEPEPPVLPVLPELPLPVCATAEAAVNAAAARIVVAHFPMLINYLL
jgi:hypothetical protein